jgi:hypothetical protein
LLLRLQVKSFNWVKLSIARTNCIAGRLFDRNFGEDDIGGDIKTDAVAARVGGDIATDAIAARVGAMDVSWSEAKRAETNVIARSDDRATTLRDDNGMQ